MSFNNIRRFIIDNAWAETVRLTWLWHFRAEVELSTPYSVDDYAVLVADGWTFDLEYSYWGHINRLREFLGAYDVWDDVDFSRCEVKRDIDRRILEVVYRCPDEDDGFLSELPMPDEDGTCTIESMTSRLVHRRSRR